MGRKRWLGREQMNRVARSMEAHVDRTARRVEIFLEEPESIESVLLRIGRVVDEVPEGTILEMGHHDIDGGLVIDLTLIKRRGVWDTPA